MVVGRIAPQAPATQNASEPQRGLVLPQARFEVRLYEPFEMRAHFLIHFRFRDIVGEVIFTNVALGIMVKTTWLYLAGGISALMISSAFSGFCPVYFVLNKVFQTAEL